ncbi:endonuclease NucS [Candidatus Bathyarchaeota archaeon]|nr:endonuclease NucS [Candidatus Bathyarchaeota archaeon]MBS7613362.1 endonuclease NucS [Candidatus Bathyarchaeota archaeon]MBS7618641.1 endonuclease NucS [Candidatus Bathyarchaeota archaeon]
MSSKIALENPSLEEALEAFKLGVSARRILIIVGECRIDYFGRGHSELDYGDRVVTIKNDGALIIHRPFSLEPVNWQPSGSMYRAYVKNGSLIVEAYRRRPEEKIRVTFRSLLFLASLNLRDYASFKLYTSEEIMKKAFIKRPEIVEKGLRVVSEEKKVRSGLIDCLCVDSNGKIAVVEFKKSRAGVDAVEQLSNYVQELRTRGSEVRGMLVAPSLTREAGDKIKALNLEFKRLSVKKCIKVLESTGETTKISDFTS